MNCLTLNVSGLNLNLDLSDLEADTTRKLTEIFSPFVSQNESAPYETLNVFRLNEDPMAINHPGLESLIKKCLELPLKKYPFSGLPKRRIQLHLASLKTFLKDSRYILFFDHLKKPEDVLVYPLNRACLIWRHNPDRSAIFLKSRSSIYESVESIREAVYFLLSIALPSIASVLLHGVGVKRNGLGHLFLGDSGAGKSTIARYSRLEDIVSDDGIIVERKDIGCRLRPSPINQSSSFMTNLNNNDFSGTKLNKGFFIEKDRRDYLERVSPTEACSLILKKHIHYFRYFPISSVRKSLFIISSLCRQVPFYVLHFRKDSSFWSLIEGDQKKIC